MKNLILVGLLFLSACGHDLIRDPAPGSIEVGHKRVETVICDSHEVGENGCVFPDGVVSGKLKIYRVLSGSITLKGQGCGVDQSFEYAFDKNQWIEIDLPTLVGPKLAADCVIDIYQRTKLKGQDQAPFPIEGIYGTVTLGICPPGVTCRFEAQQTRAGWHPSALELPLPPDAKGSYLLRGCGQELSKSAFQGPLHLDLETPWPGGYPKEGKNGCLFILGLREDSGQKFKVYHKVWLFKENAILLNTPALTLDAAPIHFQGDPAVTLTLVDGRWTYRATGMFKPLPEGNILRFYTVQGRTLVVSVKEGAIEWMK